MALAVYFFLPKPWAPLIAVLQKGTWKFYYPNKLLPNSSEWFDTTISTLNYSLVPRSSKIEGGEGLVHTVCACVRYLSGNYYIMTKMTQVSQANLITFTYEHDQSSY